MSRLITDLKRIIKKKKQRTFVFYLLVSQMWRKSWGFQASGAYPSRGCQLFPLEDTPANSCINHVCCEQKKKKKALWDLLRQHLEVQRHRGPQETTKAVTRS